jgi:hypothetical protein
MPHVLVWGIDTVPDLAALLRRMVTTARAMMKSARRRVPAHLTNPVKPRLKYAPLLRDPRVGNAAMVEILKFARPGLPGLSFALDAEQ